jgi:hypothetical protein
VLPISVQLVLLVRQGCEKTARGETVLNLWYDIWSNFLGFPVEKWIEVRALE